MASNVASNLLFNTKLAAAVPGHVAAKFECRPTHGHWHCPAVLPSQRICCTSQRTGGTCLAEEKAEKFAIPLFKHFKADCQQRCWQPVLQHQACRRGAGPRCSEVRVPPHTRTLASPRSLAVTKTLLHVSPSEHNVSAEESFARPVLFYVSSCKSQQQKFTSRQPVTITTSLPHSLQLDVVPFSESSQAQILPGVPSNACSRRASSPQDRN